MPVLLVENVAKTFRSPKGVTRAVDELSFTLEPGAILAFLGPNGAGKTTTIRMIAGLVRPSAGRISVNGLDPLSHRKARQLIGAVLEGSRNIYWRLTPLENLLYFGALRGLARETARDRGLELLRRFGLFDRRNTPVYTFSRGMQQKVAIATSLLHKPRLLLLDEPTLGLDVHTAADVKLLIRELAQSGTSVLLTTHQLNVAEELADQVSIIREGRVVADGRLAEVLADYSRSWYRIRVRGQLIPEQLIALSSANAELSGDEIVYRGPSLGLYDVISALHPLDIVSVVRDQANLTDVFMKLTSEAAYA